jgi:NADH-quinone oxidoreductase subunit A
LGNVLTALALVQQPMTSGSDVLVSYLPILIMFVMACGLGAVLLTMSRLVGQRKPTKEKLMPYECGKDPVGSARERHSVRFYMVAMIFLLFDIEAIFLIPWAVAYGRVLTDPNATTGLQLLFWGEMMAFIGILFAGLIYIWKKGVFEWNR